MTRPRLNIQIIPAILLLIFAATAIPIFIILIRSPFNNPWHVHILIYTGGLSFVTIQHYFSRHAGLLLFAMFVLPGPLLLPSNERTHRALTSFTSLFYFCRMFQVQTRKNKSKRKQGETASGEQEDDDEEEERPLWLKLAHVFGTFMDTRVIKNRNRLNKKERTKYFHHLVSGLIHFAAVLFFAHVVQILLIEPTALMMATATLCAGLCSLMFLTGFGEFLIGSWGLGANVRLPWLMRKPAMSISLREFWGRRWNGVIQRLLKNQVYERWLLQQQCFCRYCCCCHGNRTVASIVTFMCSGLIHAYPVYIAHATRPGLKSILMFQSKMYPVILSLSYFVIQVILMFLQDKIQNKIGRNMYLHRFFTIFSVVFPGPLLVVVFLTLPLSPETRIYQVCMKVVQSFDFILMWTIISLCVGMFVSVGATWMQQEEEEDSSVVVVGKRNVKEKRRRYA